MSVILVGAAVGFLMGGLHGAAMGMIAAAVLCVAIVAFSD